MEFREEISAKIVPKKGRLSELAMRLRHEDEVFAASSGPEGKITLSYSRVKYLVGMKTLVEVEVSQKGLAVKHVPLAFPVEMGPYYVSMLHRYAGKDGVVFERAGVEENHNLAALVSEMSSNSPELFARKQNAILSVLKSIARDIRDPGKYTMVIARNEPVRDFKRLVPITGML